MDTKLILIVEDETDLSEALQSVLEDNGFKTLIAKNGQFGLKLAQEHKPDLILLDLMMPFMSGKEMLTTLRAQPWGKDMKVIILTSEDNARTIGTSFEQGVDDYIVKGSTSLADIVKIVKDVCTDDN